MEDQKKYYVKKYYVADWYSCPVHEYGYSSKDRRCSCRFYWTEDYNPLKVKRIASSDDDMDKRNDLRLEYENE